MKNYLYLLPRTKRAKYGLYDALSGKWEGTFYLTKKEGKMDLMVKGLSKSEAFSIRKVDNENQR